jgi:Cyclic nucleotide-binding domain
VANEDRVTVFGLMEGFLGVMLLLGSLLAPALLSLLGTRGSFAVAGLVLPILAAVLWRPVRRDAQTSARRESEVALLRRNSLFAPLPLTALDLLAERLQPTSYRPGDVIMRQGEPGNEYVLIADGEVEVSDNGHELAVCGPGEGVGEIALLRSVPRTATVAARTQVSAYVIDGPTFLAAIAGPAASAAAHAVTSARLERSRATEGSARDVV